MTLRSLVLLAVCLPLAATAEGPTSSSAAAPALPQSAESAGELQATNLQARDERFDLTDWDGPAIPVRLFVPTGASTSTPVVIVMHGWSRDAKRYFADWRALATQQAMIIAVPLFGVEDFPKAAHYNLGHVFDVKTDRLRPRSGWAFTAIEAVFDAVVARTGSLERHYTLYGHSAGGQFVHRFAYYMPAARAQRLLAANAGWYTMPHRETDYPYGLAGAAVDDASLAKALARDLVILVGREDVDHTDPNLRNTPETIRQGKNRFLRGLTMFDVGRTVAEEMGVPFNWRLAVVDDAGHVNAEMAPAAARFVDQASP